MGGMEFNKIFAAVLLAGIVASLGGFLGKALVHAPKLGEDAYVIEGLADGAGGAAGGPAPMAEPILAMIATADVARGERLAKACAACHTFDKGGANGVGPNLWGTVGGSKDHIPGFAYSGALAGTGGPVWTYAEMNKFLWKPKAYAKDTKMNYLGIRKPEDRAALIAWLRTKADAPKPLPTDAEIAAEVAELTPPEPEAPAAAESAEEAPAAE